MDKALHLISLARRAGRLALGFDAVEEAVVRNRAALVLLSRSLSERTQRNIRRICADRTTLCPVDIRPEDFAKFVGKAVGVLAINDPGFAAAIQKALPAIQTDTV